MGRISLIAAGLVIAIAAPARANIADVFDVGPAMGRAGAVGASVDDAGAAFYNPAGLGFRAAPKIELGIEGAHSELKARGERFDLAAPWGLNLGLAAPVPFVGPLDGVVSAGVLLHVLPRHILVVDAPATGDPYFPYYQNRSQRLLVLPAIAVRLHPRWAIGIAVNYFAGLDGAITGNTDAANDLQLDVDERIVQRAVPHLGVRYQGDGFRLGITYRSGFVVPVNTRNTTALAGKQLTVDVKTTALFTPDTLVASGALDLLGATVALDLSWRRWSAYRAPYSAVHAEAPTVFVGESTDTMTATTILAPPKTRDVGRAAIALSAPFFEVWRVDAGYAIESSGFVPTSGQTTLLDGPKHVLALGASLAGVALGDARLSINASAAVQWLPVVTTSKDAAALVDEDPTTPGRQTTNLGLGKVSGGGAVLAGVLTISVELPERNAARAPAPSTQADAVALPGAEVPR